MALSRPSLRKESPSLIAAFILFAVVVVLADSYIISSFSNTSQVPKQISSSAAQPMLQALIQTDGVLLGFVGAVFAVVLGRNHKMNSWVLLVQAGFIFASLGFFLSTIIQAFLSLASSTGLTSSSFALMLSYTVNGVVTLFFAVIASHEVQSIAERFGLGQKPSYDGKGKLISDTSQRVSVTSAERTVCIKFYSNVDYNSVNTLMSTIDQKMKEGVTRFKILISSGGGNVFHGLAAYNYLVGLPVELTTHNFGSVDSVSCVIFCAGSKRYSVPNARFLMHGVQFQSGQPMVLEEKQLEERLKSLKIDAENIAKVIASTTRKDVNEITKAMSERTTFNPEQAKEFGLVHEIKSDLVPQGAELVTISQPQ